MMIGCSSNCFSIFLFFIFCSVLMISPGSKVLITLIRYYLLGKTFAEKSGKYSIILFTFYCYFRLFQIFYTENSLKFGAFATYLTSDALRRNFLPHKTSVANFFVISLIGGQYIPHLFWK